MKKEILETISNYLDTLEIRDGTEGSIHTNTLFLQFNVDGLRFISEKYNLKGGDKITKEMNDEILIFIGQKFEDFYLKNKDSMPWNN